MINSLPRTKYVSFSSVRTAYNTVGEYLVQDILPHINNSTYIRMLGYNDEEYKVRVNSSRLLTFKNNLNCVNCSKEGNIFLLQFTSNAIRSVRTCFVKNCSWCYLEKLRVNGRIEKHPHLNLWHRSNNGMHLMTQDHIHPRSKGGSNNLSNLQTMCRRCNSKKSDHV